MCLCVCVYLCSTIYFQLSSGSISHSFAVQVVMYYNTSSEKRTSISHLSLSGWFPCCCCLDVSVCVCDIIHADANPKCQIFLPHFSIISLSLSLFTSICVSSHIFHWLRCFADINTISVKCPQRLKRENGAKSSVGSVLYKAQFCLHQSHHHFSFGPFCQCWLLFSMGIS